MIYFLVTKLNFGNFLGGLILAGNPLRCGCSASWVGAWLRRWTSEVGGGTRSGRWAARSSTCVAGAGSLQKPLLALHADEAECHASALSSRSYKLFATWNRLHIVVLAFLLLS